MRAALSRSPRSSPLRPAAVALALAAGATASVAGSCKLEATDPPIPPPVEAPDAACGSGSGARACQITARAQRIGGPAAIADVGDFLLENDRIRVAVLAPGNSTGPGLFGGSIVDADIVRPLPTRLDGHDRFSEIFPIVNFAVPGDPQVTANPSLEPVQDGLGPMEVEVLCPGDACPEPYRASGAAVLRVSAKGASLISALDVLRLISVQSDLSFQTDYVLEPGRSWVRIHTEIVNDGCRVAVPGEDPFATAALRTELGAIPDDVGPFDIMLGDSLRFGSGEPIETAPGVAGGDFLLFGPKLSLFSPGHGYGLKRFFLRSFERQQNLLGSPPRPEYMAGVAGDVSYGYFSAGNLQVPILTGSFTAAFSGERRLPYPDQPPRPGDECALDEYTAGSFFYDRYFVVGDGDAGAVARARFEITGQPFGSVAGNVVQAGSRRPLSGADVLVLRDPDPARTFLTAREVMDANSEAGGDPGVVLALKTDRGLDDDHDGSFDGPVAPGSYLLVARVADGPPSVPVRATVGAGSTTRGTLVVGGSGLLRYRVVDERGVASPAKLTILDDDLGGSSACAAPGPLAGRGAAARSPRRYVELGDSELPDGITRIVYTTGGEGQVSLEPGRYEVIASRGIERGIDRACVTIRAGSTEQLTLAVPLEVDTPGWINGDFHVHGVFSYDASVTHADRVRSAAGEGLELLSSSDHDWVADLGPTVRAMQLENVLATQVGIETTTIESGHFIGFPLRFDPTAPEGGAIDWSRRDACLLDPAGPRCTDGPEGTLLPLTPGEIFDAIRDLGTLGPERTPVIVPHPRDGFFGYFDQFSMSPYDLSVPGASFLSSGNPLLRPEHWSRRFDAIELMNGKRYELLRTPSAGEVSDFSMELTALLGRGATDDEIARAHEGSLRRVLARTPEEQQELAPLRVPGCLADADCGTGESCDPHRQQCAVLPRCAMPMAMDCPPELVCETTRTRCVLPCEADADCRQTEHCEPTTRLCVATTCLGGEPPDRACPEHEGTIDDWFRLLNAGLRTAGMGNSDTHDLHEVEVGMPRNFVRVGNDTPLTIDAGEVADAVRGSRMVASMGPFVELTVADAPIGETARGSGSVRVHVRVQTPDWFGVDRVEVYRNGTLVHVVDESSGLTYDPRAIVDYDDGFDDDPGGDAWYVAIAMATGEGRGLAPVYTSNAHPSLGISQVASVAFAGLPSDLLRTFLSAPVPAPELNTVLPYAVTNPVWLDADGDGAFTPPNGPPPWPAEDGGARAPLTSGRAWTQRDRLDRAGDLLLRYLVRALETGRH